MTVNVRVENKHGFEQMKKAFRRAVDNSGILHELREREFYTKPSEKIRRKKRKLQRGKKTASSSLERKW